MHVDLPPGEYRVVLQKAGLRREAQPGDRARVQPHQFRLLTDGLLGYAWPKWVRSGEAVRVPRPLGRAVQAGTVALRLGAGVRPRPRLARRARPAGRRCRSRPTATTPGPASSGTRSATRARVHSQYVAGPGTQRAVLLPGVAPRSGRRFAFPWVVAPAQPDGARSPCWPRTSPGTPTTTSAGAATTSTPTGCRPRRPSTPRPELQALHRRRVLHLGRPRSTPPLSFDRPEPFNHIDFEERITDPIEGRQACHLAPAEWRLLGWLEARGLRLRLLRRDAARRRHARPRRVPRAGARACTPSTGRGGCTTA